MRAEDAHRLERAENAMVRWMSGVNLGNKMPSVVLRSSLSIEGVMDVVSRGRLRWFGHIVCKGREEWVSACRNLKVRGSRGRGRGRKT